MTGFTYEPFLPEEENVPVWRYLELFKLLWALREKKLWLTLLNRFNDPFEASVPTQTKYDDVAAQGNPNHMKQIWPHFPSCSPPYSVDQSGERHSSLSRRRRALLRAAHASCWRLGDESEAMWRLYCGGADGVAMRSTFSKLRDSISDNHTIVSKVEYIDYKTGRFVRHNHDYDPALHKRSAFAHEREVRVLRAKKEDFLRAGDDENFSCDEHVEVAWDPEAVIEDIVLSPLIRSEYVDVFTLAIHQLSPTLADRVHRSELTERPQY